MEKVASCPMEACQVGHWAKRKAVTKKKARDGMAMVGLGTAKGLAGASPFSVAIPIQAFSLLHLSEVLGVPSPSRKASPSWARATVEGQEVSLGRQRVVSFGFVARPSSLVPASTNCGLHCC